MRIPTAALGTLIGAGVVVAATVSQAETKMVHGQPHRVVASVNRGRAYETPLAKRCVWVGVPAGLVGGGIGYFVANGANLGAALLGALTLAAMSSSWRENWPERFGRAGENAQVTDRLLNGMVGGLLGAFAAAQLAKHHPSYPQRLQPPEPADVC